MVPSTGNASNLILALTLLVSLWGNTQSWLKHRYSRRRKQDVAYQFTVDMAVNHLPHLWEALRSICIKLDIPMEEPPPIRFVQFEETNESTSSSH